MIDVTSPVLLFDERCSICRRFVSAFVHADARGLLRIAPLTGALGEAVRREFPEFSRRDSAVWLAPGEQPVGHSDAILAALRYLGGRWRSVSALGRVVPRVVRDGAYRAFASHRPFFARFGLSELDPLASARVLDEVPAWYQERTLDQRALASYLTVHLSGSVAALQLMGRIARAHEDAALGPVMARVRADIEGEQQLVRELLKTCGVRVSPIARMAGWLGGQLSRITLGPSAGGDSGLRLFEALEALTVGFHGRRSLWHVMAHIAEQDVSVAQPANFRALADRATAHIQALEPFLLNASLAALTTHAGDAVA